MYSAHAIDLRSFGIITYISGTSMYASIHMFTYTCMYEYSLSSRVFLFLKYSELTVLKKKKEEKEEEGGGGRRRRRRRRRREKKTPDELTSKLYNKNYKHDNNMMTHTSSTRFLSKR